MNKDLLNKKTDINKKSIFRCSFSYIYRFLQAGDDLFFKAGDVGLRDAELVGYLLLCQLLSAAEGEAEGDDLALALVEVGDGLGDHPLFLAYFDVAVDAVAVVTEDVRKQQLVAVPIDVKRFVDGYFTAL